MSDMQVTSQVDMATPHVNTDGRTGRTYEERADKSASLQSVTRAGGEDDFVALSDVIGAWGALGERHPVIRTGERAPIPPHVRAAVWYRDRGICQRCRLEPHGPWHLDHIHPWSAGGSDRTTNLRLLCKPCNVGRSNWDDGERSVRGVTWWCHRCYVPNEERHWEYTSGGFPFQCSVHGGRQSRCRVMRAFHRALQNGAEWTDWHRRSELETFTETAYCAHCNAPGLTSVVL